MGREPGGKGKQVCFCLAGLILFFSGCAVVGDLRREGEARQLLASAAEQLARGDYQASFIQNQRALELARGEPPGDEALFGQALVYAHAANPDRNSVKAMNVLRRIIRDFPRSPLTGQAKIWIGVLEENGKLLHVQEKATRENEQLLQENQKLKQVIEKSKRVDIEIEQKKRERER
jgi:hypothetical protein